MRNARQNAILTYLAEHGEAKNSELLSLTEGVSAMTLWRDLEKLEAEGLIMRFRGGAASTVGGKGGEGQEINFLRRVRQNTDAKESIAEIAASLMQPDQAYFMDAGSTVYTLVHHLHSGNYNFITSAVNIAAELAKHTNYDVTMLGGQVGSNTLSCSGPQTEEMLRGINIDIAIMAASGWAQSTGFTSGRYAEAQVKKMVVEKSAVSVMLIDAEKLAKRHPFTFAELSDIDALIGDENLPEEFRYECRQRGILVFTPDDGRTAAERDAAFRELLDRKHA